MQADEAREQLDAALDKHSAGYMGNGAFISKADLWEIMKPLLARHALEARKAALDELEGKLRGWPVVLKTADEVYEAIRSLAERASQKEMK